MAALDGASKYLNNLLLARGLLQDGKSIEFAHPAHGCDTTDNTMTKVINLIHELVLRRDRESEQSESMAALIRNLRAGASQHALDMEHMQDKRQQLQNDTSTAQARERTVRTAMRNLETQIRDLKEQNMKMKSMLDQVRAKCTSDVRRRDVEIEKLKGHLVGLQRGKKDISGMKITTCNLKTIENGKERQTSQDTSSTDWTLARETNDFLAAIIDETSTENVSLREIVGGAIEFLKEMTGSEDRDDHDDDDGDGIGIPGQYRKSRQKNAGTIIPVNTLSEQVNTVLHRCRLILKDPSFVPIEEVQIRDEEIAKLRAGWERMADRWKEAVTMMSQWKQRMTLEGKATDIQELSDLSFGRSVAIRPDGQPVLSHEHELSSIFEESRAEESIHPSASSSGDGAESELELEPEPVAKRLASSPARRGVKLPRLARHLTETSGNTRLKLPDGRAPIEDIGIESYTDLENPVTMERSKPPDTVELTISEKLAAVEAEATEANTRRQRDVARKRKLTSKEANRKTNRRRSTLSPAELARLMGTR